MHRMLTALAYDVRRMMTKGTAGYVVSTSMLYVTMLPHTHRRGTRLLHIYLGLAGGFAYEEIIALALDNVFVWTLLALSYLVGIAGSMQAEYQGRCRDTLYRFASYRHWYTSKALAACVVCVLTSVLVVLGALAGGFLWGARDMGAQISTMDGLYADAWPYAMLAFLLLTANMIMLSQWQMLVHLLTGSVVAATAAFLLPILWGLYAASNTYLSSAPLYNPINWGMLYRSNLFAQPGFSLPLAFAGQLSIAALCFLLALIIVPHINLAGRAGIME
jgi:hypothetical protein